jgi:hypothetical protein
MRGKHEQLQRRSPSTWTVGDWIFVIVVVSLLFNAIALAWGTIADCLGKGC